MTNFYTDILTKHPLFHSVERVSDINLLEPVTRVAVMAIITDAKALRIDLRPFETYRSVERQRSLSGSATGLHEVGVHHFGLACDLVIYVDGEPTWKPSYAFLGNRVRAHSLVWGGDWGKPGVKHERVDEDHVQRVTLARQPALFLGAWYPDERYNPYSDGAR